jgi:hypothetical protein
MCFQPYSLLCPLGLALTRGIPKQHSKVCSPQQKPPHPPPKATFDIRSSSPNVRTPHITQNDPKEALKRLGSILDSHLWSFQPFWCPTGHGQPTVAASLYPMSSRRHHPLKVRTSRLTLCYTISCTRVHETQAGSSDSSTPLLPLPIAVPPCLLVPPLALRLLLNESFWLRRCAGSPIHDTRKP